MILDIRFRLSRQRARFAPGIMAAVLTLRTTGGRPRHEKLVQGDYCPAVFNPSLTICGAAGVILGQDYGANCPRFIEDLETEVADFETGEGCAANFCNDVPGNCLRAAAFDPRTPVKACAMQLLVVSVRRTNQSFDDPVSLAAQSLP
ncbi:hypothetical protein [Mameliella alba]|uniref:hypothetical protein n=2 Tax=Mameliella TaxID=1434019 RepID=UPI0018E35DBE|nr:hypothetical protein [Mameliella alba]